MESYEEFFENATIFTQVYAKPKKPEILCLKSGQFE